MKDLLLIFSIGRMSGRSFATIAFVCALGASMAAAALHFLYLAVGLFEVGLNDPVLIAGLFTIPSAALPIFVAISFFTGGIIFFLGYSISSRKALEIAYRAFGALFGVLMASRRELSSAK
mgnify:CR=1 FL=1